LLVLINNFEIIQLTSLKSALATNFPADFASNDVLRRPLHIEIYTINLIANSCGPTSVTSFPSQVYHPATQVVVATTLCSHSEEAAAADLFNLNN